MAELKFDYDIIVVGAGHAGCEAASAAAISGSKTLLITQDMNTIAQMSCNPAIGGIAKGQIVREIDALGGQMGIVADKSAIQFRMLNQSKGPAMWSPRCQSDRKKYITEWISVLNSISNLYIWQDTVSSLIIKSNRICGVKTGLGVEFNAKAVILTAGTFLNGNMHFGEVQIRGGRISESSSLNITEQLVNLGFRAGRMKTGTPARVDKRSIDFSKLTEQQGENTNRKFSFLPSVHRVLQQQSCWITYTNSLTHSILKDHLTESPLYNGQIQSIGPRYCPSIETKIVTFADKEAHQIFLEPEGENSNEYYINGFSSSMPWQVQWEALRTIKGLENVVLYRPGYAIEYDYFDPTQLHHSLETKLISGLFFAGQINGTTGYEEAAGQGLIAGINAHRKINSLEKFTLSRDESYIGVLIDDLVTKGVDEPYRMFTSRAEYRILLRQDNADRRLTEKGYQIGLANEDRYKVYNNKLTKIETIINLLHTLTISPDTANPILQSKQSSTITKTAHIHDLLTRPEINIVDLLSLTPQINNLISDETSAIQEEIIEEVEIEVKYAGYINREKQAADKLHRLEQVKLKSDIDYNTIQSLSTEARQKLSAIKPASIAEASRIPGVSPNDISVLLVLMGR